MLRRGRCAISVGVLLAGIGCELPIGLAQRTQMAVDWSEANTRAALENVDRERAKAGRAKSLTPTPQLSLPRWGFGQNLKRPSGTERARSFMSATPRPEFSWPSCASPSPKISEQEGETRDWYSDDYDWGCISLNIVGDRNVDASLKTAVEVPQSDCDFKDGRSIASTNAAPEVDRGSFVLHLRLNGIPYTINGTCLRGAEAFCINRRAQCELVERLVLRGGRPQ